MRSLRYALLLVGCVVAIASLLPIFLEKLWWARLLVFPAVQLAATLLAVIVAIPFVLEIRRPSTLVFSCFVAAALAYQVSLLLPYTSIYSVEVPDAVVPGDRIRIVSLNVQASNRNVTDVLALVRETRPDLFFATETNFFWQSALAPLQGDYPYRVVARRNDYWGMMLFSKLPLEQGEERHLIAGYIPSIKARVVTPSGRRLTFHGLHPKPPIQRSGVMRDAELLLVAREVRAKRETAVLAGDFNDVPWSPAMRLFKRVGGLQDPRVGRGFFMSFSARYPIIRWPLDHIMVAPGIKLSHFGRLRSVGSDHFPVMADLVITSPATKVRWPNVDAKDQRKAAEKIRDGRDHASRSD